MHAANSGGTLRFPFPRRLRRPAPAPGAQLPFLERRFTPRTVFMDIGAADCALALRAAGYVERVYAVDVSGHFLQNVLVPCNLRLVLCDGVRIPVRAGSVDLAFSGGFVDQLHPDDAAEHFASVRRALAHGGQYFCLTKFPASVRRGMLAADFLAVACYAGALRVPWVLVPLLPAKVLRIAGIK